MARPDCPPVVLLGPTMGPAVRASVARLRECLADPDPKIAVRAAAELTRLLAVCARQHVQLDADEPPPTPVAPPPASPAAPASGLLISDLRAAEHDARHAFDNAALPPNLLPPARVSGSPHSLTSFLGKSGPPRPSPSG